MHKVDEATGNVEFALLILLGVLSGIPYALTKVALATIPPITMVAARVSLAAIATGPGSRYASFRSVGTAGPPGALAQWQSSGLLTHWFRVRPPGAPPGKTSF